MNLKSAVIFLEFSFTHSQMSQMRFKDANLVLGVVLFLIMFSRNNTDRKQDCFVSSLSVM